MNDSTPKAACAKDPRRFIQWDKIRGPRAWTALATATALGAGLVPKAPGTAGALAAIPLAYFTQHWDWPVRALIWTSLTAAGTWAAKVLDELMRTGDHQSTVMDEVVGLGITAFSIGYYGTGGFDDWKSWLCAFILFRFFDIVKPFPVRLVDQWSKKKALENSGCSSWYGGFGVMADDVVAGFQGLAVMLLLQHFGIL